MNLQKAPLKFLVLLSFFFFFLTFPPAASAISAAEEDNIRVYERLGPSVVNIVSTTVTYDFFYTPIPREGSASGVILDGLGHIVTNYHVVRGARNLEVTLFDGSRFKARIVGVDPPADLAVIKINATGKTLKPVIMGDSSSLRVGQKVLAIGNPFGLKNTLTVGIVSSTGRTLKAADNTLIRDVIQTDAAINPGNSGGPLLDSSGAMVGLNTALFSPVGGSVGIGFAIPINRIKAAVDALIEKGYMPRVWMGIAGQSIEPELARALGLPRSGILIADIFKDGPAYRAGLKGSVKTVRVGNLALSVGGDLVTEVNGVRVETMDDLAGLMDGFKAGEIITLKIIRKGRTVFKKIKLAEMPR